MVRKPNLGEKCKHNKLCPLILVKSTEPMPQKPPSRIDSSFVRQRYTDVHGRMTDRSTNMVIIESLKAGHQIGSHRSEQPIV